MVRLLGAALLGGADLGSLTGAADAGRGKRGRRGRCRPGKAFDRVKIEADGDEVRTKPLAKGQKYLLRVSGVIEDDEWGIDGEYYFLLADPGNIGKVYDRCFDGTPVEVDVDGASFTGWGVYRGDHVYERTAIGKGKPLTLRLSDCYYPGNTGSLSVEVRCA